MSFFGITYFGPQNTFTHTMRDQQSNFTVSSRGLADDTKESGAPPAAYTIRAYGDNNTSEIVFDDASDGVKNGTAGYLQPPYVSQVVYPNLEDIDNIGKPAAPAARGFSTDSAAPAVAAIETKAPAPAPVPELEPQTATEFRSNASFQKHIHMHRRLKHNPQEKWRQPITTVSSAPTNQQ